MAKAKKLPSGSYRVLIYDGKDEYGKRQYKSFTAPDKAQAEFLASEYRVKGKKAKSNANDMTLAQALEKYIDAKENVLSPSTIQAYRSISRHRLHALQKLKLIELNSAIVQSAINREAISLSPKTVANVYGLISATCSMFMPDLRLHVTLPAKRRQMRQLPTPDAVVAAVHGSAVELPVMLSLWLSLRLSEVRGLQYGDIDGDILTVRRVLLIISGSDVIREQTKTYNSTRQLRIPDRLKNMIGTGEPDEPIVKDSAAVIYNHFTKCIKTAGLPHMRFHDLRHLNASVMLQLGVPDKYAMERGGWSTNAVLQSVYQHTFSDKRKDVDAKIDKYFNALCE
ncbi:tyrosine-type recombinase/integrase [Butyricicoccus faecihominis]|uniref:tyrosine-type recombinase/integrase n=1 Tax=Butyricicoccus faecihominis TaxID=1712515 RepID=UPI0024783C38|nr:tyrosine-type recombinase/integrase [Butyricicoccus faecihominis]MCQ5130328.1 tyrosine-type recombinase/integrase [Butyricicoccus faecihominis]